MQEFSANCFMPDVEDGAVVKIGGTMPDKFAPNINASKWDDECFLNINHPDTVTDEIVLVENGVLSQVIKDNTHRFYILPDGKLEYEIEFAKRPPSDTVAFNLTFTDGLMFLKQLPLEDEWALNSMGLTLEEYLTQYNRPADVINSYAVYWNKNNNKYKTGKFMHIYRPKLIDADGKEMWVTDMNIDPGTKTLTITMPSKWLDNAKYPVILDPVIGYSTAGASSTGFHSYLYHRCAVNSTTDASGGNITRFHCAISGIESSPSNRYAKLNVVKPIGNDMSGQPVIEQVELPLVVSDDVSIAAPEGNLLLPNTKYTFGHIAKGGGSNYIKFDRIISVDQG